MSAPGVEKRLREIKGRSDTKPFAYHIGDWVMLDALKVKKTPLVCTMARQFWPGPVTLVVLDTTGQKIGIRFPRNRIALALILEVGEPFIASSANRSGKPSAHTAHHVIEELQGGFRSAHRWRQDRTDARFNGGGPHRRGSGHSSQRRTRRGCGEGCWKDSFREMSAQTYFGRLYRKFLPLTDGGRVAQTRDPKKGVVFRDRSHFLRDDRAGWAPMHTRG